jgi:hypothetical protein
MKLLCFDVHSAVEKVGDMDVVLHYNGEPIVREGIEKVLEVSILKDGAPQKKDIEVVLPKGWKMTNPEWKIDRWQFSVLAENAEDRNEIKVKLAEGEVSYTILSAKSIKMIPAAQSAPKEG